MAGQRPAKHASDRHHLKRRAAERAKIALPASIQTLAGRKNVSLLNLSETGAMLEGEKLPGVGQDVVLKSGQLELLGIVAWAGNGRCGVTFDNPISREAVQQHWFEGLRTEKSGVTPEERAAAKDWATGRTR